MDFKGKVASVSKGWDLYPTMHAEEGTTPTKARVRIDLHGGGYLELELPKAEAKRFPFGADVTVCVEMGEDDKPEAE